MKMEKRFVRKRSGQLVEFEAEKIRNAIAKAFEAVNEQRTDLVDQVTAHVIAELPDQEIFGIEFIQDAVERSLVEFNLYSVSKAYILYRNQHTDMRKLGFILGSNEVVDNYIHLLDWRVKENSNMSYSMQGLNNHISTVITGNYWLSKLYPEKIRKHHETGDFHIHDLGTLGAYCCGWDLPDLLKRGFGGVSGKLESKPAKRLRTALGQIVNFFYTLQGESAGAQAFSNFDTYLAPFVYYEKLSYEEVKQAMQEFVFNMNVPTRVGFQCMSEDTVILTPAGWKKHNELKEGDVIRTFNIKTGGLEDKPIRRLFAKHYKGKMYNLRNRIQDQLITPEHRVVRKLFSTKKPRFVLEPIEDVVKLKSKIIIPLTGKNTRFDSPMRDDEIRLLAWVISEGTAEQPTNKHRQSGRITIYQSESKNASYCREITKMLDALSLSYAFSRVRGTEYNPDGTMCRWRLNANSSRRVHAYFGDKFDIRFVPECVKNLSKRQARLFIDTYRKADGQKERFRISVSNKRVLAGIQQILVDAEYGFTSVNRGKTIAGKKDIFVLSVVEHPETYVDKITEIDYNGIVWCPNTDNETVVAMRNGKVFVTGNTPFTNLTLDLVCPKNLRSVPAIVGGKEQEKTLGEFQKEMDLLNKVFIEVMMEGDAKGRIFTFPIPTYNITKDFDWENPAWEGLWAMTAKYGIPYFANFVNSDMSPDDARSMCLHPDEELLVRENGHIQRTTIGELVEARGVDGWAPCTEKIEALSLNSDYKSEWAPIKNFLKVREQGMRLIRTRDGKFARYSMHHPLMVLTPNGLEQKLAKDVVLGDYLVSLKTAEQALPKEKRLMGHLVLDEKLAFLLGFFTADGNYLFKHKTKSLLGMQLSLNEKDVELQDKIKKLVKELFSYAMKEKKDPRYNTHYLFLYRKELASLFFSLGFRKYGRLPNSIFDSPKEVIQAFLDGFFAGDGYAKRQEIHINDKILVRDLSLLYSIVGVPNTIKFRNNSQALYLQHAKAPQNVIGQPSHCISDLVPGFLAKSTYVVPGLNKNRMIGLATLQKYNATTALSEKLASSDVYPVRVMEIQEFGNVQEFYDIELEKNNIFVHSLGIVSHNCCRLRLDNRELRKRGGGLFGANPLTGSIGVVTLNLPRLAYLAKTKETFYPMLAEWMGDARDSLVIKRKILEHYTMLGLYPYSKHFLEQIFEQTKTYWSNHFSTIGLIGMNECLLNLIGKPIATPEGKQLAEQILDFMRNKISDFQEQTNSLFNLEATPAEGASYRLARIDKAEFPDIKVANEQFWCQDHCTAPYYSNSSHLPVNYTHDVFEALDNQDSLQTKYTGGTVLHIFVGEKKPSSQGVKELVRTIAHNYHLPYFTLTPTFSVCPSHGYMPGEQQSCPQCKAPCEVYSRIVGYFRPIQNWNAGKRSEFGDRLLYELTKVR